MSVSGGKNTDGTLMFKNSYTQADNSVVVATDSSVFLIFFSRPRRFFTRSHDQPPFFFSGFFLPCPLTLTLLGALCERFILWTFVGDTCHPVLCTWGYDGVNSEEHHLLCVVHSFPLISPFLSPPILFHSPAPLLYFNNFRCSQSLSSHSLTREIRSSSWNIPSFQVFSY